MNWRTLLPLICLTVAVCLHVVGARAFAAERFPDSVRDAMEKDARFRDQDILKIYVRRPAPTTSGFMYEVVLDGNGGEELIYVDPDKSEIIYTTAPNGN